MDRIPVSGPWITQKEIDFVTDAATNAWYGNSNMYQDRFEKAFAAYLGVRFAMALPSCTSAIHLSLLARGIGPGDEVIVPDITWIASAAPVCYVGAQPIFADIDPRTWCLSPDSLEECITPRTKAVIPVDLYGNLPEMDKILAIARRHNLTVIEDAAEAIGSEFNGQKAGSFGDTGTFSFHGSKTMTTGEGGMLVTNSEEIHKRASVLRDHGRQPGDKTFFNSEVGYKYKMSSLQAALGLAQLERIDDLVERKREIFHWYQQELEGISGLTLNYQAGNTKNTYWMVTVVLDRKHGMGKNDLADLLGQEGIDTRPFFHPLSSLPAFNNSLEAHRARARNCVAQTISALGINLPSGFNLTPEKVKHICGVLKNKLVRFRPRTLCG